MLPSYGLKLAGPVVTNGYRIRLTTICGPTKTFAQKLPHRCQLHLIQFTCIQQSRKLLFTPEYRSTVRTFIIDVVTFHATIMIFMEVINNPADSGGHTVSKCGSAPTRVLGLRVRIPLWGMSLVCCAVEVFETGRSLVRRSPTECDVPECDRITSTRKPWSTRGCRAIKKM
jgi:hypothetical protein